MESLLKSIIISCLAGFALTEWSHNDQDAWPEGCRGSEQSPINIDTKIAVESNFSKFVFGKGYGEDCDVTITNAGYTVSIELLKCSSLPTVSGGGLPTEFALVGIHVHWPSEHSIDGKFYPLEVHLVHINRNYKSFEEAKHEKEGIAVFAVLYEISEQSAICEILFKNIIQKMPLIANNFTSIFLDKTIIPKRFLPLNTDNFYRYQGSLTTPNCNEAVTWTIFSQPAAIVKDQLEAIKENIYTVKNNNRQIQPLNGRTILVLIN